MNQGSIQILNMVDLGASYQMIEMLPSKEAAEAWKALWATWCRTFGMPQHISVDEGLEFRGAFTQWSADYGTVVFRAASRSPWQQGKTERHGDIIKKMIDVAREGTGYTRLVALRHHGYSWSLRQLFRFANVT